MPVSIQIAGAEFANVIGSLSLPSRVGLAGEYIFGGTEADCIKNRARPGLASMTKVGTPAIGANFVEIRSSTPGNNGFDTGLVCPPDATIIVVVKKDTGMPVFMSTASPFSGFHNYLGTNVLLYNSQSGTAAGVADVLAPTHTDYAFYAGAMPAGGLGKIYNYVSGVLATNVAEINGGARGTDTLKIGTSLASGGVGVAKMAYAALYDRVLTEAEVAAAYASLKGFLATRAVVVS